MRKLLPLLLAFFSFYCSYSQNQMVTSMSDNGIGSLRAVVASASAGDTITFDPLLLSAGANDTIFLASEILIDKSLYFYGLDYDTAKIFISGNDSTRIFRVDVSGSTHNTLTFHDYFFTNAKAVTGAGNGGALRIVQLDTLRLENCQFEKCHATNTGGAIYAMNYSANPIPKHTEITGCKFSQNSAPGSSFGNIDFYMTGSVNIDDCEFTGSLRGGSKFKFCEGLYITNSTIRNNGSLGSQSTNIFVSQTDTVYAGNITAYNNKTSWHSPVLWIAPGSLGSLIENSLFFDNQSDEKAGVFHADNDVTVKNCHFYNNSASFGGVTTSEEASFEQCVFKGNSANFHGGILFYTGRDYGRYATFYQCELDSNSAGDDGGAVFASHSDFRFERSSATRNHAGEVGGAFRLLGFSGSASFLGSTISQNFASDEGGAISISNTDSIKIRNCTFANNVSTTAGSFIYFIGTDSVEIEGSIIINHQDPISYYGTPTHTKLMSQGHNLLEFNFPGTLNSDLTDIDSSYQILDSLQSFGGIGMVMPPLPKSLAINRGNPLDSSMPQNGNIVAAIRDIGAFESQDSSIVNVRNIFICDSFYLDGNWHDTTGLYMDTALASSGVDSVSYTWVNNVHTSIIDTQTVKSCDSYTWIDGNTYSASSDTARMILSTHTGCDSIIVLDYTRLTSSFVDTQKVDACGPYTWIDSNVYFDDTDTAYVVLSSVHNCDSTIYLDLTFVEIDTAVSLSNMVLTAMDTSAEYQWVDCGQNYSPVANGRQQHYAVTDNGSYAVILSKNGCKDTSACVEINDFGTASFPVDLISVYPNPTNADIRVDFKNSASVSVLNIYNASGKLIRKYGVQSTSIFELQLDQPPGIYFIEAVDKAGYRARCKVVKY